MMGGIDPVGFARGSLLSDRASPDAIQTRPRPFKASAAAFNRPASAAER